MPRAPRIEFEGAAYHVMARGNHREDIMVDDADRMVFVRTFGEACEMCGWEVFAWALMENHYHAVFRTPHGNFVEGMKWFLEAAKMHFGLDDEQLRQQRRGDFTRAAIASRLFRETTVSQNWIAEAPGMKSAPNVCQQIKRLEQPPLDELPKKIRRWKNVKNF